MANNIKAIISKNDFERVKNNPDLAIILTFSRIVNAIHFCLFSDVEVNDTTKPSAHRAMINSFFYSCAALYEGIEYLNYAGQFFRSTATRDKIRLFNRDIAHFKETVLNKIRNNIAFHNKENIFKETIKRIEFEKYIFSTTRDFTQGETYYILADEVALNSLLYLNMQNEEEKKSIQDTFEKTMLYCSKYIELADFLISEKLSCLKISLCNESS